MSRHNELLCLGIRNRKNYLVGEETENLENNEEVNEEELDVEEDEDFEAEQEEDEEENDMEEQIEDLEEVDQYIFEKETDYVHHVEDFEYWMIETEEVDIFQQQRGYTDLPDEFPRKASYA